MDELRVREGVSVELGLSREPGAAHGSVTTRSAAGTVTRVGV